VICLRGDVSTPFGATACVVGCVTMHQMEVLSLETHVSIQQAAWWALLDASEAIVSVPEYGKAWFRRGNALTRWFHHHNNSRQQCDEAAECMDLARRLHAQDKAAGALARQRAAAIQTWLASAAVDPPDAVGTEDVAAGSSGSLFLPSSEGLSMVLAAPAGARTTSCTLTHEHNLPGAGRGVCTTRSASNFRHPRLPSPRFFSFALPWGCLCAVFHLLWCCLVAHVMCVAPRRVVFFVYVLVQRRETRDHLDRRASRCCSSARVPLWAPPCVLCLLPALLAPRSMPRLLGGVVLFPPLSRQAGQRPRRGVWKPVVHQHHADHAVGTSLPETRGQPPHSRPAHWRRGRRAATPVTQPAVHCARGRA